MTIAGYDRHLKELGPEVRFWHEADVPQRCRQVRF